MNRLGWHTSSYVILCLAVTFVAGCQVDRRFARIMTPCSPFGHNGIKTQAWLSTESFIDYSAFWVEWTDVNGQVLIHDSRELTSSIEAFLEREGVPVEPKTVLVDDPRYASPRYALDREQIEPFHPGRTLGLGVVRTIVCLDPIVVVEGPGSIPYRPYVRTQSVTILLDEVDRVLLSRGFMYGKRLPFSREAVWFSPTLNIPPQPAEVVDENRRRIPVPWGALVLTRGGDEWVVTAELDDSETER